LKSASAATGNSAGLSRSQQERQSEASRKSNVQQSSNSVGNSFAQSAAPAPAPSPVPQLTTFPVPPKINNSNMNVQNNMASAPSSPPATTPPAGSSYTKPQNTISEQKKDVADNKELNSKKEGGNAKMESAKITTFPIPPKINNVQEEVRKAPELQKGPVDPQKLLADALNTMTVRQLKAYIRMNDKKTTLKATSRKKEYVNAALAIAQDKGLDDSLAELQNKVKI
jgi:hypothetical protein